jgi:hypothetical protein
MNRRGAESAEKSESGSEPPRRQRQGASIAKAQRGLTIVTEQHANNIDTDVFLFPWRSWRLGGSTFGSVFSALFTLRLHRLDARI